MEYTLLKVWSWREESAHIRFHKTVSYFWTHDLSLGRAMGVFSSQCKNEPLSVQTTYTNTVSAAPTGSFNRRLSAVGT
jgi:hypothetical protein